MKKTQKNKAITLVALVITMVVLIILAGISINMLFGENGIITKAKLGKTKFLAEDSREIVEQKVAYLRQDAAHKGVDTTLFDFWYMYNGDINSDYYTDEFNIYLFTDEVSAKLKPANSKTALYKRTVEYKTAVVIYNDYVSLVNDEMIVSNTAIPVEQVITEDNITAFNNSIANETNSNTILSAIPTINTIVEENNVSYSTNNTISTDTSTGQVVELITDGPFDSNDTTNYLFSASTVLYPTITQPFKAFNSIPQSGWGSTNQDPSFLQIEFKNYSPIVKSISLKSEVLGPVVGSRSGDYWKVNSVYIEASNDGNTFTQLTETINTASSQGVGENIEIDLSTNNTRYKYYRIQCVSSVSGYDGLSNVHIYGIK